jgi:hypothetical protein
MKTQAEWDEIFATNRSWPPEHPPGLTISNRNPNPTNDSARNIYQDDKAMIHRAADKHGYVMISTAHNPRAVTFVKRLQ